MLDNSNNVYDFWGAPKKSTSTLNSGLNTSPRGSMLGSSRCTCGGMGSPSCPVHGGMSKQSNGLGNSTTQNSFGQTPTPWAKSQTQEEPQFDNTRDAVAYAWDKQHPNGGMTKMTGPLGDISYYDENLYKPNEEEKQTDFRITPE